MKFRYFLLSCVVIFSLTSTVSSQKITNYLEKLKDVSLPVNIVDVCYNEKSRTVELSVDCIDYAKLVFIVEGYSLNSILLKHLILYTINYTLISITTDVRIADIVFGEMRAKALTVKNVEVKKTYDDYGYSKLETVFLSSATMQRRDYISFNKKYLEELAAASRRMDTTYLEQYNKFYRKIQMQYSDNVRRLLRN